jgi:hypothetical protein
MAGTVTQSTVDLHATARRIKKVCTIEWIADATDHTVPTTNIIVPDGWILYSAETIPGSTAPTDNYDIVLNDADGLDVAGGLLANRDEANAELVLLGSAAHGYPLMRNGSLSFVLTNNLVDSATGTLILIFVSE